MPRKRHKPEEIVAKLRLWLADGCCIRLRAEYPNHVWTYDFVEDRTHEGKKYRMLRDKRCAFALT